MDCKSILGMGCDRIVLASRVQNSKEQNRNKERELPSEIIDGWEFVAIHLSAMSSSASWHDRIDAIRDRPLEGTKHRGTGFRGQARGDHQGVRKNLS